MAEQHAFLNHSRILAKDVLELDFRVEQPLRFRAGQFLSLHCGYGPDGMPVKRSYSIASPSSRADGFLVATKLISGGPASAFLPSLRSGDQVHFTGPMGFFVLDLHHSGDVVFAATGTGITPVIPMLAELLPRAESGAVRVFWGLRAEEDLFYRDELAALEKAHPRLQLSIHLTQPSATWRGPRGRITDAVLEALPTFHQPTFYLVGNGDMIRELRGKLVERGIDRKKQTRTEAFFNT